MSVGNIIRERGFFILYYAEVLRLTAHDMSIRQLDDLLPTLRKRDDAIDWTGLKGSKWGAGHQRVSSPMVAKSVGHQIGLLALTRGRSDDGPPGADTGEITPHACDFPSRGL